VYHLFSDSRLVTNSGQGAQVRNLISSVALLLVGSCPAWGQDARACLSFGKEFHACLGESSSTVIQRIEAAQKLPGQTKFTVLDHPVLVFIGEDNRSKPPIVGTEVIVDFTNGVVSSIRRRWWPSDRKKPMKALIDAFDSVYGDAQVCAVTVNRNKPQPDGSRPDSTLAINCMKADEMFSHRLEVWSDNVIEILETHHASSQIKPAPSR
jgi:hypothetical protein